MRPLTDHKPKPLIDVAGTTLLDTCSTCCATPGSDESVVNVHYFPDQIEAHLAGQLATLTSPFPTSGALLRDTGGGWSRRCR
jgi:MurNAc alpha-1-phosphate uridylyltransferase